MVGDISVLCSITKKELERHEALLAHNIRMIDAERSNMDAVHSEVSKLRPPSAGSFRDFNSFRGLVEGYMCHIEEIKGRIAHLELLQGIIRKNIKEAHIKYEKMKYMREIELEAALKKRRASEHRYMDELSTIMHVNNRGVR